MFKLNKNSILIAVSILAVAATAVLVFANFNPSFSNALYRLKLNSGGSAESLAKKSLDYINSNLLQQGQIGSLESFSEESGLIKIKIKVGDTIYDSYVTKDGKLLFPINAIQIETRAETIANGQPTAQQAEQTPSNVVKVPNTSLDVYVVSRCPFGLQIQRAIAEAIKDVPSLADYVKVKYIGSVSGSTITAMHGKEEAQENFRQICIREEQKEKYWPYVSCQMKSKDAADGCLSSTGIDINKLNTCLKDPNRGLAYAKEDFAGNVKHNITGSPTLILNGQEIADNNFGGRSADSIRNIICSSSVNQPDFCSTKLNTNQSATAFSLAYAKSGSGAVSSGADSPNCSPVQ